MFHKETKDTKYVSKANDRNQEFFLHHLSRGSAFRPFRWNGATFSQGTGANHLLADG
ncbi:hypothetical protein [Leptospira bourretii]|uniref:hypothetical protein n=1 Tax=Leptospira bourretii TaxID=2484962 RepID=UPI001FCAC5B1|nr:hypothetical protein [Leptospira bourretii]